MLLLADVLLVGVFALKFMAMPEQLPLFYSRPWGEPQIVDYWYIILIPILMHVFFFLNMYLSKRYLKNETFLRQLFRIANICIIIAFSSIFLKIIFLVT
jgi:hypothetical protein